MLDLVHNTAAAYYPGVVPNTLTQVANKVVGAVVSGLQGGGVENWARLLGGLGVGVSAIVGARAYSGGRWL
jgi:hypothetical protein